MTDTKSEWTIRPLTADDRADWATLWQGYLRFYDTEVSDKITETTWTRLITDDEEPSGLCAAHADGHLAGLVHYVFHRSTWSETNYCYLEDLFVDPETRGQGLGGRLIKAVEDKARASGATRLYWHTQHYNTRARVLYDRVSTLSPFVQYRTPLEG